MFNDFVGSQSFSDRQRRSVGLPAPAQPQMFGQALGQAALGQHPQQSHLGWGAAPSLPNPTTGEDRGFDNPLARSVNNPTAFQQQRHRGQPPPGGWPQPIPPPPPPPPTGGLDNWNKGPVFGGNVSPGKDMNGGLLQPLPQLPPTKYDNPNPHQTPPWNPNPNPGPETWATDGTIPAPPGTGGYNMQGPIKGYQMPYDTRKDPMNSPPPPEGGFDHPQPLGIPGHFGQQPTRPLFPPQGGYDGSGINPGGVHRFPLPRQY